LIAIYSIYIKILKAHMNKIGVGIVTCNRPTFFLKSLMSIPDSITDIVVVNDGDDFADIDKLYKKKSFMYLHNSTNLGVGKSKNKLMRYLLSNNCDHIFIIEDDIVIKDPEVFNAYTKARNKTGIQHFNFGYHGPANKAGISGGKPVPRFIVDYGDIKIAINMHSVGAFCYYTKEVLNKVGLIDEDYTNAFEHVDHDYRIAKAGFGTPYWNFADIANSCDYLEEIECSEHSSAIRPRKDWQKNIQEGALLFQKKHGYLPSWQNAVPDTPQDTVKEILKVIYKKHAIRT
jgi:GT2 family glycosyltransferase